MQTDKHKKTNPDTEDERFPLPVYDSNDDIYSRETEISFNDTDEAGWEIATKHQRGPGSGLDIPGSELDDSDEAIGEEDEENNFYSLGGDEHDDLEEENTDLVSGD